MTRTSRQMVTFDQPFALLAVDEMQPAGTYAVDTDEELIEGLTFLAYRRVAMTIYLPLPRWGESLQAVRIDPSEMPTAGGSR